MSRASFTPSKTLCFVSHAVRCGTTEQRLSLKCFKSRSEAQLHPRPSICSQSLQEDVEDNQSEAESDFDSGDSCNDDAEVSADKASHDQEDAVTDTGESTETPSSAPESVANKKFEEVASGLTCEMKKALLAADAAVAKAKEEQAAALAALEKGRADVESMLKQKVFAMLPIGLDLEADADNAAAA